MEVLVLVFCLLSALCGGNAAKVNVFIAAGGGNGSINCHITPPEGRKFFCKNECEAEDILIKTDDVRAQSGRYSFTYRNDSSGRGVLTVTFTNLSKSDSGRYRCGMGKALVPKSYADFEVRVSDAPLLDGSSGSMRTETEGEEVTIPCSYTVHGEHKFLCRDKCNKQEDVLIETDSNIAHSGRYSIEYKEGSVFGLYVTFRQATRPDTGRYRCGYGRALAPDSYRNITIIVVEATSLSPSLLPPLPPLSAGYSWPLVVSGSLVGVLLLVVVLLLVFVWRTRKSVSSDTFPVFYKKVAQGST